MFAPKSLFDETCLDGGRRKYCRDSRCVSHTQIEKSNLYIVDHEDQNYDGFIMNYHENIPLKDVEDWSKVVVPFYSWKGCGGVFLFKVFKDFCLISYSGYGVHYKMWYDGQYIINIDDEYEDEYDISKFKKIINDAEIQAIRRIMYFS